MKERNVELEYQRVTKADLPIMIALYDEYLNGGDSSTEHLRKAIAEDGYIGVKCLDAETIAGVMTAIPGVDLTYPHPKIQQQIINRWDNGNLYSMDMVLVQPQYQGQSIAQMLAVQLRSQLLEADVQTLIVEMWNPLRLGDRPAEGVLKYLGKCLGLWDYPDFYEELYARGMSCPKCGKGPCRCGATIGIVDLNHLEEI